MHVVDQADLADVDLLLALLDEAAAGVDVVVGELLLHLADAEAVGDQLVGIDAHLVLARDAAEAGDIDDAGTDLNCFSSIQSSSDFSSMTSYCGIGAVQRVPVDLADRAPVGADLRLQTRRAA